MFVSRTDGKTTSTIKVHLGEQLGMTAALLFVGLWLVDGAIFHPIQYWRALAIGLLLLLSGFGLGHATLRLIWRSASAYLNATDRGK
jgi:hypothetical protein